MKKVLFIFAMIVAYSFSVSATSIKNTSQTETKITVVADVDDFSKAPVADDKKDKKVKKADKTKAACCASKKEAATGCSETQKKSCAASKKSCCDTKKEKK